MLSYVTIGVRDHAESKAFYDAFFAPIGSALLSEDPRWLFYGKVGGTSMMDAHTGLCTPFDGAPAKPGNGVMPAYFGNDTAGVEAAHAAALANGGTCEGKPGFRPEGASSGFYAAYVRDPVGNKIAVFSMA